MPLSTGEKIAIAGGVAGAAIVVGAAVAMAKKSKVTITATTIVVSVTPLDLPSSGGKITISGTTTNIPAGTNISILVNGKTVDTFALSGSSFSVTYDVSANTSTIAAEYLTIVATGAGVKSNAVTVTVAPSSTVTGTVDITIKTDAGATVTVGGQTATANSSGFATFKLAENTTYTASGKLTVTIKSSSEICEELYEGSVSFTAGTSAQTVDLPLTLIARKCYSSGTLSPSISIGATA